MVIVEYKKDTIMELNEREQTRLAIIEQLDQGQTTLQTAMTELAMPERRIDELLAQYRLHGAAGMMDGRRRSRPRGADWDKERDRILAIVREQYSGRPISEIYRRLRDEHGFNGCSTTIRRWMHADGLAAPRPGEMPNGDDHHPATPTSSDCLSDMHQTAWRRLYEILDEITPVMLMLTPQLEETRVLLDFIRSCERAALNNDEWETLIAAQSRSPKRH